MAGTSSQKPVVFLALASEGMGHATRAAPLISKLRERGYDVEVFCGGRVADYLRKRTGPVNEHFFIPLHYKDNQLDVWTSFKEAFLRLPDALRQAWNLFWRMRNEKPVAVISDFEFMSAWIGWWSRRPVIALDNMHIVSHGNMPKTRSKKEEAEKKILERAIFWNQPVVDKVLIQHFWQVGVRADHAAAGKVAFVPCATRPEVLAKKRQTRTDGAVLVYQTSSTNKDLPGTLRDAARRTGLRFKVYGAGKVGHDVDNANVEYCAFSEDGFLTDLAHAPFVVVNGGHSTMVEALALGKPVLSEPIQKQFEQRANAIALEQLGVGQGVDKMTADAIAAFAQKVPAMREAIAHLALPIDNDALADAVEAAFRELNPHAVLPRAPLAPVTNLPVADDYAMAAE
jgi:uncharacterized protein (TIGR00661 family)